MKTTLEEGLAAMRRELARQDADWESVKRTLASFGEAELAVPSEALAELDGVCTVPAPHFNAVRA